MKIIQCFFIGFAFVSVPTSVLAETDGTTANASKPLSQVNTITLESQVKGNQEQPNVLSIVPWKEASSQRRIESGIETDIGRLFQHLDKDEFARQQYFYKRFLLSEQQQKAQQTELQTHN